MPHFCWEGHRFNPDKYNTAEISMYILYFYKYIISNPTVQQCFVLSFGTCLSAMSSLISYTVSL